MRRLLTSLLVLAFGAGPSLRLLPAQSLTPSTLAHRLTVGDTARTTVTVRDEGGIVTGAAITFTGTNAAIFTAHRDGKVTARAEGCAWQQVGYGTWTRARVSVCVVAKPAPPVVPPVTPPAPALAFASDWSRALGNSREAVTDGGTWPALACERTFPATLLVMRGDSVGFPGSNVLRVQMRGPTDCGMLQKNGAVPASTTHWGRFYVRNDERGTKNDHPVAYHNIHGSADIQGVPFTRHANNSAGAVAGEWVSAVIVNGSKYFSPRLRNGPWYRYEWQMEYVTPTTVRIHPRLFLGDSLVADARHYALNGATLAAFYAGGGVIALANGGTAAPELARNFGMGNEGPGSSTATMGYWYYARVALSTAGWVGR